MFKAQLVHRKQSSRGQICTLLVGMMAGVTLSSVLHSLPLPSGPSIIQQTYSNLQTSLSQGMARRLTAGAHEIQQQQLLQEHLLPAQQAAETGESAPSLEHKQQDQEGPWRIPNKSSTGVPVRQQQTLHDQEQKAQQPSPPPSNIKLSRPKRMVIATGANNHYFGGLQNLVGSVRYWCQECPVVVFNLGLSDEQKRTVQSWCNVTLKWRDGIHVAGHGTQHTLAPKKYAWKPFAILQAVDEHKQDAVLWLDAGSTVTGPLMPAVWHHLAGDGHFLVQGQDLDMTRLCMQETFDYLRQKREDFINKPSYAGNTVGFVYDSAGYHNILLPWVNCAGVEACIAPPGSSTANHRFDQVVLSIITYTSTLQVTEHTEILSATRLPCFEPNERVIWTSRQGETCYIKYASCS